MGNDFFAFAPNGGYFCNFHRKYKWQDLDKKIHDQIKKADISRLVWAAFGPEKDNVFFAWVNKEGIVEQFTGDDTPALLKDWLKDCAKDDEKIRVTLGPEGSFFAWDSKRLRWHGIPHGLEKSVQSWLRPTGWSAGPPRIVTLGTRGSYFAITEAGSWSYNVHEDQTKTAAEMKEFKEKKNKGEFKFSDLAYINFSSCAADEYLWVRKNYACRGNLGPGFGYDEVYDVYFAIIDSQKDKQWVKDYKEGILKNREARKKKEKERKEKESKEAKRKREEQEKREAEEAKAKKAEEARTREEEEARARKKKAEANEDMAMQYLLWRSAWEDDLTRKKMLTVFPQLPVRVCTCAELSCTVRKADTGVLACEHDLEKLLRASGMYGLPWLRKERLLWHPDRFGQRCDMDFRRELMRKATEMYALFGVLIDKETEGGGEDG